MRTQPLLLRLALGSADQPAENSASFVSAQGPEILDASDSERLLHLARRRAPLAVLIHASDREKLSDSEWCALKQALERLPRPPRILRYESAPEDWVEEQLACAADERRGRELLAELLALRLDPASPHEFAERLLALSAADDAPRVICGDDAAARDAAARALHDLSPRPAGGFLSVRDDSKSESAWTDRLFESAEFAGRVSTLFVDGLEEVGPERLAIWIQRVHGASPQDVRLVFGRSEGSRPLPAELESRCLRLPLREESFATAVRPARQAPRLDALERQHVLEVLDACSGNKSRAASQLGIHRSTLHTKLRAWGLATRKA